MFCHLTTWSVVGNASDEDDRQAPRKLRSNAQTYHTFVCRVRRFSSSSSAISLVVPELLVARNTRGTNGVDGDLVSSSSPTEVFARCVGVAAAGRKMSRGFFVAAREEIP